MGCTVGTLLFPTQQMLSYAIPCMLCCRYADTSDAAEVHDESKGDATVNNMVPALIQNQVFKFIFLIVSKLNISFHIKHVKKTRLTVWPAQRVEHTVNTVGCVRFNSSYTAVLEPKHNTAMSKQSFPNPDFESLFLLATETDLLTENVLFSCSSVFVIMT